MTTIGGFDRPTVRAALAKAERITGFDRVEIAGRKRFAMLKAPRHAVIWYCRSQGLSMSHVCRELGMSWAAGNRACAKVQAEIDNGRQTPRAKWALMLAQNTSGEGGH